MFFVLSGFLITGLILGEYRRSGTISIRDFYARRAKRLLPLACTVLLLIAIASLIIFQPIRQTETAGDILAAALYFVNWRFIVQDVDYFAVDEGLISPVQHYWSLSVEEQFYLLWPVLLLSFIVIATRFGRNPKGLALTGVSVITAGSLAYSIVYTPTAPEAGYFSTLTRAWELGAGAVLALVLPRAIRMHALLSNLLVVGGVATILTAGYLFNETDPYPGWRALVPVLGTVFVIVGGSAVIRGTGVKLLATAPLQYLGKISYAWYLWHWPFIVFAIGIYGDLSPAWLVVVTLLAWIPSEISHRLIEEPLRRTRRFNLHPGRALAIGAVFSFVAVGSAFALGKNRIEVSEAPESRVVGAKAIKPGKVPIQESVSEVRPDPTEAREDRGSAFKAGCLVTGPIDESPECRFDEGGEDAPRVVLYGDSHALQYSPALRAIARKHNWNLTVLTRGNCLPADTDYKPNCDEWRRNTLERIEAEEQPDLTVVATSTLNVYSLKRDDDELSRDESEPLLVEAMAETLKRLRRASGKVVLIRDQARSPFLAFECVAENPKELRRCVFEPNRHEKWAFGYKAARRAGIPVVDPMPMLCGTEGCPSVIGNALVYRDTYHLSATYSRSLADWLYRQLERAG